MTNRKSTELIGLTGWLILTFGVAFIASQFEPGEWYQTIAKPSWTPPGWIFGPVWGMLYLLMGVAAWDVWRQRRDKPVTVPLVFYIMQLVINGLWSWLFFRRHWIDLALIDLLLLVLLVVVTLVLFFKVNRRAAFLLAPYLLWISFASVLNFQIWSLN